MLLSFVNNKFPEDYVATVFDNYTANIMCDSGKLVNLGLWDTAGQEDLSHIRTLSYLDSDVIILCFGLDLASSFNNVKTKWMSEIKAQAPKAPVLLVGTKMDKREETENNPNTAKNQRFITYEEGKKLSEEIKAQAYVECSARTFKNLQTVFKTAVEIAITAKNNPATDGEQKKKCTIL